MSALQHHAARTRRVDQFDIMGDHDAYAIEPTHRLRDGLARPAVHMIGWLVQHQHVGIAGQRTSDLQPLGFASRESLVSVCPIVADVQRVADGDGLARPIRREIIQIRRRFISTLRTVGDCHLARVRRDCPRIGGKHAAGEFGQCGLANAIVSQHCGPDGRECRGQMFEQWFRRARIAVGNIG